MDSNSLFRHLFCSLVPNILLSASDDGPTNIEDEERIDASKLLTDCVVILTGADSDETKAKVLTSHIR